MKKLLVLAIAVTMVFSFLGTAEAVFLGDTITIEHNFSTFGAAPQAPGNRTVAVGGSDIYQYFNNYTVNPEPGPDRILIRFLRTASWVDNVQANGPLITNIDDTLQNVTVNTNLAGWNISRLSFSDHQVRANWSGLPFNSSSFFNMNLDFGQNGGGNAIPEPATMMLLGSGLLGMVGFKRKRS